MAQPIPVVDLFAGPGGLGEGFSSYLDAKRAHPFRIALSIEKDAIAHATLELRAFFRQFKGGRVPGAYYELLRGIRNRQDLFSAHKTNARTAAHEAWLAELGATSLDLVRERIQKAVGRAPLWVLVGGPPCQAYSVAGRSRNKGNNDYDPESDVRQTLYVEYLQILADHRPPVFVMENVKGLLSATLAAKRLIERIVDDLSEPHKALRRERRDPTGRSRGLRYRVFPLAVNGRLLPLGPEDYLVCIERHGVPQARHRVILLGIREDVDAGPPDPLLETAPIPARAVLDGLPRLRSGLSRLQDSGHEWLRALRGARNSRWLRAVRGNGEAKVAEAIREALREVVVPRKDRGGEFVEYQPNVGYEPEWFLDERLGGVCNHATRSHMVSDLHRYLFASSYAKVYHRSPQLRDFPNALLPDHRNVKRALVGSEFFADRFRVQVASKPATTITSHVAKDGHYYIHPDPLQCRSLTVREAARLQTFPDNYFFCGNRTSQYAQVGNAVPPLLAFQIAGIVHQLLR